MVTPDLHDAVTAGMNFRVESKGPKMVAGQTKKVAQIAAAVRRTPAQRRCGNRKPAVRA